jgi:hypothetical protein
MGTATFSTLPTAQTILLHINDSTECSSLYGAGVSTCFVLPGTSNATLTLVKNVNHGGTSDSTAATAWTLTATGSSATLSGAGGATGSVPAGTYQLSETGPGSPGWTNSGYTCGTSATVVTSVTLASGDNTTCTITNTAVPPKLTLVKNVDHSGTSDATLATAWTLSATQGTSVISGAGGVSNATADIGSYALAESGPGTPGWTSSGYTCGTSTTVVTSVTLALGDSTTCTITNTAVPPKLTLVKVVDHNATGDTTAATAWTLKATKGTSVISGAGGVSNATADIGSYALSESGPGAPGWTSSGYTCGTSTTVVTSVTLALGDSATCTITNTAVPPKITIVKKATGRPGGGDTFTFAVNGPSTSTQSVTTSTQIAGTTFRGNVTTNVMIGSYTISENANGTWVLTGAVCYSGAEQTPVPAGAVNELPPTPTAFTLALGGQETCVFENTLPVTRTQGFWATHYNFTNSMWSTKVPAADQTITCGTTVVKNITNVLGTATSNLYGGFWSGISKTSTGKARTALDQARMKLVQQLEAAILNHDVFGAPDNGKIAQAKADYCGTNATAITNDAGALGSFNQSGEVVPLDPSQFALTPAEPQKAQTTANKATWDVLP